MGEPLSVNFRDIYMVKMENGVLILSKLKFSRRFLDDIYSNVLFDRLNSYPNIKLIQK